jgi:hypothetical protein
MMDVDKEMKGEANNKVENTSAIKEEMLPAAQEVENLTQQSTTVVRRQHRRRRGIGGGTD